MIFFFSFNDIKLYKTKCVRVIWGLHMNNLMLDFILGFCEKKYFQLTSNFHFLLRVLEHIVNKPFFNLILIKLIWATYRSTTQTLTLSSLPNFCFFGPLLILKSASQVQIIKNKCLQMYKVQIGRIPFEK